MADPRPRRRVLVVDPDRERGEGLAELVRGFSCRVHLHSGNSAWSAFAGLRPDVVLLGLAAGDASGETFLRRLQTEYMGTIPPVYFVGQPELFAGSVLEPDGLLVPPVSSGALLRVLRPELEIGDTNARQISRLRELFELTALSNDLLAALDVLVGRVALTFRVDNCLLWGPGQEDYWPRLARQLPAAERSRELARARLATTARVTMVLESGGEPRSYLAAPLSLKADASARGGLCLIDRGGRLFSIDERDALRALARRLAVELRFVSAHVRLLRAHNELRASALTDPLLGVWTRAAFERAVERQSELARRRNEPLALAVIDFVRLRAINDRWGHPAGDAVLAHLAQTVREALRGQDQVGRFGGDELAVLLPGTDAGAAEHLLGELLGQLAAAPFERGKLVVPLEVTIGVTDLRTSGEAAEGAERAFARALGALRRARRAHQPLATAPAGAEPEPSSGSESSLVFDLGAYTGITAGSTIGGMYRILHEISRGAIGVVYRGEDLGLGRPVAIKVLRTDLASDRSLVARFREEAAVLASLHHDNLVDVYSFGEDGDEVYFVMELVEGEPLSELIDRGAAPSLAEVVKIIEEIAEAIDAMHAAGVIHRDVKPANILLDRINDRAVLVDVGVARRTHETADAAGTPGFAAPESFTDTPESAATDVYGLATTTYAALTGGPPFGSGEVEELVNRQLFDPLPPASERRAELGPQIDAVLARALAAEPEDRYSTATAFAVALSRALFEERDETPSHPREPRASEPAHPPPPPPPPGLWAASPPPVEIELAEESLGGTHGAFFALARKLVVERLEAATVREIRAESPRLDELLDPALKPSGWRPIEHLLELLIACSPHTNSSRLAFRLGRSMISATLTHAFGADPRSVAPVELLEALPTFWHRYHRWGAIQLEEAVPGAARLRLGDKPDEPEVCALVGGMLSRIPELGGSPEVSVTHPTCTHKGHPGCVFIVRF